MSALRSDGVSVVALYGIGGVGKTTLVKEVARQAAEKRLYNCVVFATVSRPVNLKKIQDQIAKSFDHFFLGDDPSCELRARKVKERELSLRDVGVPNEEELMSCGSKIVTTSRSNNVCLDMERQEQIKLETWTESESRVFFKITTGAVFESEEFERIADSVADECGGIPLALKAVAKAMGSDMDKEEWEKALQRLQQSWPPNYDDNGIVYKSIKFSYDYLRAEAQTYFLMCCLFPEDHNIWKEEPARYVFGLGVIIEANTVDEVRGEAETIAKNLVASGLFLDGDKGQVKMHDVVRDVAIQITSSIDEQRDKKKHVFMVQTGNQPLMSEWPIRDSYKSYTAISVMSNDILTLPSSPKCTKLKRVVAAGQLQP